MATMPEKAQTMTRRLALIATAAALGAAGGLVVSEGVLRAFDLAPTAGVATVTEAQFGSIPGLLAPNQDVTDRRKAALSHRVRVNGLGYRGPEFPRTKPSGETRLVMAGDSFTYGDFVNDDDTLPAQLQRELTRRCPRLRVINAGIGGTTIDAQSHMVERALTIDPDLVVLTFSENDLDDFDGPSAWDQFAANRRIKSTLPMSVVYPVLSHLALWHFALDARVRLSARFVARAAASDGVDGSVQPRQRAARI